MIPRPEKTTPGTSCDPAKFQSLISLLSIQTRAQYEDITWSKANLDLRPLKIQSQRLEPIRIHSITGNRRKKQRKPFRDKIEAGRVVVPLDFSALEPCRGNSFLAGGFHSSPDSAADSPGCGTHIIS